MLSVDGTVTLNVHCNVSQVDQTLSTSTWQAALCQKASLSDTIEQWSWQLTVSLRESTTWEQITTYTPSRCTICHWFCSVDEVRWKCNVADGCQLSVQRTTVTAAL